MSKIKVGTQIEEDIYQKLKLAATRERRPVGEAIQDAVTVYLRRQQKSGLARLLEREPFKISEEQFRESMEADFYRSEEHTSELQSLRHLVCRLLLETKKKETAT